jgi:trehalose-6-phosphate synthase
VFSSVDRMYFLSGIRKKLQAFENILEKFPRNRQEMVLIQYITPYDYRLDNNMTE